MIGTTAKTQSLKSVTPIHSESPTAGASGNELELLIPSSYTSDSTHCKPERHKRHTIPIDESFRLHEGRQVSEQRQFATSRAEVQSHAGEIGLWQRESDLLDALASGYGLSFAARFGYQRLSAWMPEAKHLTSRLVALISACAATESAIWHRRLREMRDGDAHPWGNRIVAFWRLVHELMNELGDSQSILLRIGRQLCDEGACRPPVIHKSFPHAWPNDPLQLVELFRFREQRSMAKLRIAVLEQLHLTHNSATAWQLCANLTLAVAHANGARIIAECFCSAVLEARAPGLADALSALFSLFCLTYLQENSQWWIAEGWLTAAAVPSLSERRNALCARIGPNAHRLAIALGFFDGSHLQSPGPAEPAPNWTSPHGVRSPVRSTA